MSTIDFTEAELRSFAPKMAEFYRRALLEGKEHLKAAGILDNGKRFAHFMAQFGAETAGGTILRESLTYTTVARIRAVWPARSKGKPDAELKPLLRNPVALGDWAYGGRMGNAKGTSDGYDYRGGGFIQTTGKAAVQEYCDRCKIEIHANVLDDADATLQFACAEWVDTKCNVLADKNDLLRISKAINTGSAESGVMPNGMTAREAWFKKAQAIWWDAEMKATEVAPPPTPVQNVAAAAQSSRTVFGTLIAAIGGILAAFKEVIADAASQIVSLAPAREVLSGFGLSGAKIALIVTVAGCLYAIYARMDDASKGHVK
jgi:predicted chitinase